MSDREIRDYCPSHQKCFQLYKKNVAETKNTAAAKRKVKCNLRELSVLHYKNKPED